MNYKLLLFILGLFSENPELCNYSKEKENKQPDGYIVDKTGGVLTAKLTDSIGNPAHTIKKYKNQKIDAD
jgi:hypothetical protein